VPLWVRCASLGKARDTVRCDVRVSRSTIVLEGATLTIPSDRRVGPLSIESSRKNKTREQSKHRPPSFPTMFNASSSTEVGTVSACSHRYARLGATLVVQLISSALVMSTTWVTASRRVWGQCDSRASSSALQVEVVSHPLRCIRLSLAHDLSCHNMKVAQGCRVFERCRMFRQGRRICIDLGSSNRDHYIEPVASTARG